MIFLTSPQWPRDHCQHLKTWADLWCIGELGPIQLSPCSSAREEADYAQASWSKEGQQQHQLQLRGTCHQLSAGHATSTIRTGETPQVACATYLSRQQQLAAVAASLINPSSLRGKVASVLKAFCSCPHHVDATCTFTFRGGIVGSSHLMDGLTS